MKKLFVSALMLALPILSPAKTFELPAGDHKIVGDIFTVKARRGDTLYNIGKRYDLGIYDMIEANPKISPYKTVKTGETVIIPDRFILPDAPGGKYQGIFINLAELRLYYFPKGKNIVETFPIGIGRVGWQTPVTDPNKPARVIETVKNPTWIPTKSIQAAHYKATGQYYPKIVPAGPDNPLGRYKIRTNLDGGHYLIHGTNNQNAVGRRVSSGCIRMWEADIELLYNTIMDGKMTAAHNGDRKDAKGNLIPVSVWLNGSDSPEVRIVNRPYRIGVANGVVLLESHVPLSDDQLHARNGIDTALAIVKREAQRNGYQIDWKEAAMVAKLHNGIPTPIGRVS